MTTPNELYKEANKLKDEGKLDEAIVKLEEALKQDDAFTMAHLALAVLYGRVDRHELAIQHGEKACALEPTDSFNFTAMSVTYQRAWQGTQKPAYIQKAEDAMARAHAIEGR